MNQKRPVYRMCIVTREKLLKSDLFRLVKSNKEVILDTTQKIQGRGVYIKRDLKVIELAHKRNTLNKALKTQVDDEVYLSLVQELSKERR